jgi:uncharacterized protein involved in propanediol utilization
MGELRLVIECPSVDEVACGRIEVSCRLISRPVEWFSRVVLVVPPLRDESNSLQSVWEVLEKS